MENTAAENSLLHLTLGLATTPEITFLKPDGSVAVPTMPGSPGFGLQLEAALPYEALSQVVNGYLAGKRFELSEGIIKQHIIIEACKLYSGPGSTLMVEVQFGGSHRGTLFFRGTPVYDHQHRLLSVQQLDYDLKTNSFLLRTASWLFDSRLITEIKKYTVFDLSAYYQSAATALHGWLNREWTKGIKGHGKVTELSLTGVQALPQHLLIRSQCRGELSLTITEVGLKF